MQLTLTALDKLKKVPINLCIEFILCIVSA